MGGQAARSSLTSGGFLYFYICRARVESVIQGTSKKMSDSDFNLKSVPGVGFYFFQGCFRFRISSLIHLYTLIIPIKNLKCPKNAKNVCAE